MSIMFGNDNEITAVVTQNHTIGATGFDAWFRTDGMETEYPVSASVHAYTHTRYGTPVGRRWDDVNDAVEEAYVLGWTGLGFIETPLCEPLEAGVTTGDYGRGLYGGGHMCELVTVESNARSIRHMLEEVGARFFEDSGMFFYDIGHTGTVDLVVKIERGLSDSSYVDEMDHNELEQVIREKTFEDELPALDVSIDDDDVWTAWTDQDGGSYCPECGTGDSVEEILRAEGYAECEDCSDWFDPDHDETTSVQCTECTVDVDKARAVIRKEYGFEPATGEGLIVRMHGDVYRVKDGKWVPHVAYRNEHILGE